MADGLYCNIVFFFVNNCIAREGLRAGKLYCNTGNCIAMRHLGWAGRVLQYTKLYYDKQWLAAWRK